MLVCCYASSLCLLQGQHAALAKEIQSPRFQAILRVTSGRYKKATDIKSFSHELNSKGVRPLPFWKSRAFGRMEVLIFSDPFSFASLLMLYVATFSKSIAHSLASV